MSPYCVVGFETRDTVVPGVWHCDYQHIPHGGHGRFIDVVLIAVEGTVKRIWPKVTPSITHQRLARPNAVFCQEKKKNLAGKGEMRKKSDWN